MHLNFVREISRKYFCNQKSIIERPLKNKLLLKETYLLTFLTEYDRSKDCSHFNTSRGRPAGVELGFTKGPLLRAVAIFKFKYKLFLN